jgi:hypothetical protein
LLALIPCFNLNLHPSPLATPLISLNKHHGKCLLL